MEGPTPLLRTKEQGTHLTLNGHDDDDESEGNTIEGSIVIFNDLKCGINKNILWLFGRHKHNPRPNTTIAMNVMAVSSGKHSEHDTEHSQHDTEPACFVICTLLNN